MQEEQLIRLQELAEDAHLHADYCKRFCMKHKKLVETEDEFHNRHWAIHEKYPENCIGDFVDEQHWRIISPDIFADIDGRELIEFVRWV